MKVSIVTSVKNGQPFLRDAIASVKTQCHQDWEHLIIDAGSTDGSIELAEAEAASEPRIRFVQRNGEPLYESLLWGLSECTGEYLAWLNADDLYTPWSFAVLSAFVEATGAEWVTGFPACWDKNSVLQFVRPRAWHPRSFIRGGAYNLDALGFLQQEAMFFSKSYS